VLYQLSYTPTGICVAADPGRFKHRAGLKSKGEAAAGQAAKVPTSTGQTFGIGPLASSQLRKFSA
jgi:hypothetical protein